jgi:hypothetical protein
MRDFAPFIEDKSIRDIILPGTHASATYALEHTIAPKQAISHKLNQLKWFGVGYAVTGFTKLWSKTQNRSILQQLEDGYRYLDLRVVYRDDKKAYYKVHGLYGSSLDAVLKQIKTFIDQHPKEILIIQVGDLSHMPDDVQAHQNVIGQIKATLGSKLIPKADGLQVPIKNYWAQEKQIILIYDREDQTHQHTDIWGRSSIQSHWANVTTTPELKAFLDRMLVSSSPHSLYVVQALLTPNADTIKNGFKFWTRSPISLNSLANMVKKELPQWLNEWKTKNPNIIEIDFADKKIAQSIIQLNR